MTAQDRTNRGVGHVVIAIINVLCLSVAFMPWIRPSSLGRGGDVVLMLVLWAGMSALYELLQWGQRRRAALK